MVVVGEGVDSSRDCVQSAVTAVDSAVLLICNYSVSL